MINLTIFNMHNPNTTPHNAPKYVKLYTVVSIFSVFLKITPYAGVLVIPPAITDNLLTVFFLKIKQPKTFPTSIQITVRSVNKPFHIRQHIKIFSGRYAVTDKEQQQAQIAVNA